MKMSVNLAPDRRVARRRSPPSSNPLLNRIESEAKSHLVTHDDEGRKLDPSEWQNHYSLLNHHQRVAEVMRAVSEHRGVNDAELAERVTAALLHDMGKLDERCRAYRLNRMLSDAEREETSVHPLLGEKYVLSLASMIRKEDLPFLRNVALRVRHHHNPWKIKDRSKRKGCWDLMFSDVFVSFMEDRHRPGRSQFQSLKMLPMIARQKIPLFYRFRYWLEIRSSIRILNKLYGAKSALVPRHS